MADSGKDKKTRKRRTPEESRALIIGAATQVFAELGPDRAGLQDVARRAGISHGLITHYFGTFDKLVEEVLAQRMQRVRQEVLEEIVSFEEQLRIEDLLRVVLNALQDPITSRLYAWAFLTRRLEDASFFANQRQGFRVLVDALLEHPRVRASSLPREVIERRMVIIWCSMLSYSVAAPTLWSAMGQEHDAEHDEAIEAELLRIATDGITTQP